VALIFPVNLEVYLRVDSMKPRAVFFESICVVNVSVVTHHGKVVDSKMLDQSLLAQHFDIVKEFRVCHAQDLNDLVQTSLVFLVHIEVPCVQVVHYLGENRVGNVLDGNYDWPVN